LRERTSRVAMNGMAIRGRLRSPLAERADHHPRHERRMDIMAKSRKPVEHVEDVELQGHIIDSLLLPKVLDEILTHGGSYVIKEIRLGQKQVDPSFAHLEVRADSAERLD